MDRVTLINGLIEEYGLESYLEIGIGANALTFDRIRCAEKYGVDPDPKTARRQGVARMTSDDFFDSNRRRYGVTFIDGLHHAEQTLRDINNAIVVSNFVVVHDVYPTHPAQTLVPRRQEEWTGTAFRAWAAVIRATDKAVTHLDDYGLGVLDSERASGPFEMTELDKALRLDAYRKIVLGHPGTIR